MFIPTPKTMTSPKGLNKLSVVPPIPLERPEHKKVPKTSYITFKLHSNPTEENSPEYDFSMQYFRSGSTEDLLICLKNIKKAIVGMRATSGPNQYALVRRVLQGDALSAFEVAAVKNGNETVENLKKCFMDLKKHVLPVNAYQRQRHYMNRVLQKPKDWTIRQFMTRLTELNGYLSEFPNPSKQVTATKFSDHELTDIATNAIPNSWIKAITYHNFDPLINSPADFTSFCERIEQVEGMSGAQEKNSHTESTTSGNGKVQSRSRKGKRKVRPDTSSDTSGKWCVLHQTNTHDTGECTNLLDQAKKMRSAWEARGVAKGYASRDDANKSKTSKNVTWKKSTNENYATELGKMMCQFLEEKAKESKHVKTSSKEKSDAEEEDSDVEMAENYTTDVIDQFLNQETSKEIFDMTDDDEKELSHETKKKSVDGSA